MILQVSYHLTVLFIWGEYNILTLRDTSNAINRYFVNTVYNNYSLGSPLGYENTVRINITDELASADFSTMRGDVNTIISFESTTTFSGNLNAGEQVLIILVLKMNIL